MGLLLFSMVPRPLYSKKVLDSAQGVRAYVFKTVKRVADTTNHAVLTSLQKRYLGLYPNRRHAVEYGFEYTDSVFAVIKIANEIVSIALIDQRSRDLISSLLDNTHKAMPFVLTPSGFMNSRRVLKLLTELVRIAPPGRILDQVLNKMALCIKRNKAFPLYYEWTPGMLLTKAYNEDLKDIRRRMRENYEADLARRRWFATLQVADKFKIHAPEIKDLILSFCGASAQ